MHLVAATGLQSAAMPKILPKLHSDAMLVAALCLGTPGNESLHISDSMHRQYIGLGSLFRLNGGRRLPSKGQNPSRVGRQEAFLSRLQLQVVFFNLGMVPMSPEMSCHTWTYCSLGHRPLFGRGRDY